MRVRKSALIVLSASFLLAGCQQPGAGIQPNVYSANQVNRAQKANVVKILAVMKAKVAVVDHRRQRAARIIGALLAGAAGAAIGSSISGGYGPAGAAGGAVGLVGGAAAGSLVSDKILVPGVNLTYEFDGHTLNSVEVGKACSFQPGQAVMVSTGPGVTRIQPNATCPAKAS